MRLLSVIEIKGKNRVNDVINSVLWEFLTVYQLTQLQVGSSEWCNCENQQ